MVRRRTLTVVAVAAVLAVGIAGSLTLIRESTRPSMTVTAQFEDAVGLYEGNAVSVLGMKVGTVGKIVAKDGYVDVTMVIDGGVDIPADVQAVTVNTSILTDRHVELTPPYRGGPKLRDNDVIGLGRTRTPVEFDRTLAMIDRLSLSLRGDGQGEGPLADFLAASSATVAGNGDRIKETLDELARALRLGDDQGVHTAESIRSVVDNLAELTQAASENDQAIREFGSNLRKVTDLIAEERLGTGRTGAKVNELLSRTADLLENNRERLKGTVEDSHALTTAMVDMRRELAETFNLAPLVADNTYNTIDVETGVARGSLLLDKIMFQSSMFKELCNLMNRKQLGCATGTERDLSPDFGLSTMFDLMGQEHR